MTDTKNTIVLRELAGEYNEASAGWKQMAGHDGNGMVCRVIYAICGGLSGRAINYERGYLFVSIITRTAKLVDFPYRKIRASSD